MKKLIALIGLFIIVHAHAGVIVLQGNYQGEDLYIQNPYGKDGVGFCVNKITVNGDVTTDEVNSNAILVDLTLFRLKIGDPIEIKIFHKDGCKPKVVNPEVLKPKSTCQMASIAFNKANSTITFTTTGEQGVLTFDIEQYRWDKWVKIGEVEGKGTGGKNTYQFKVSLEELHSGQNKFRITQTDYKGKRTFKEVVVIPDNIELISFYPKKVKDFITFTDETRFEIYDSYGNLVKKGINKEINCANLKKGFYYLNFDNSTSTFSKK